MAITDDLRKTLSDPTPLYFAAGTAVEDTRTTDGSDADPHQTAS